MLCLSFSIRSGSSAAIAQSGKTKQIFLSFVILRRGSRDVSARTDRFFDTGPTGDVHAFTSIGRRIAVKRLRSNRCLGRWISREGGKDE